MPPLRERREDVPLARAPLPRGSSRAARTSRSTGSTPESAGTLRAYAWPGNVRELQNVIERACVLARGGEVDVADALGDRAPAPHPSASRTLEQVEREHIVRVLASVGGVIQGPHGAARILGLHPNTLRSRMERLGIAGRALRGGPRAS